MQVTFLTALVSYRVCHRNAETYCPSFDIFVRFQFNRLTIREAMVHEELWMHGEWLVHQGHHKAVEYR